MKNISLEKFNMLLTIVDILTCNESVKSKEKKCSTFDDSEMSNPR